MFQVKRAMGSTVDTLTDKTAGAFRPDMMLQLSVGPQLTLNCPEAQEVRVLAALHAQRKQARARACHGKRHLAQRNALQDAGAQAAK